MGGKGVRLGGSGVGVRVGDAVGVMVVGLGVAEGLADGDTVGVLLGWMLFVETSATCVGAAWGIGAVASTKKKAISPIASKKAVPHTPRTQRRSFL